MSGPTGGRTPASLTCAETAYMLYVGGHIRIQSFPGLQKHRIRALMASTLRYIRSGASPPSPPSSAPPCAKSKPPPKPPAAPPTSPKPKSSRPSTLCFAVVSAGLLAAVCGEQYTTKTTDYTAGTRTPPPSRTS